MLCDFCVRATASNPFTTEGGCKNWQNSTLTRHQQSRDHIDSVQKLELRANMAKSYKITESRNTALQSDKVENYIKQMRLVYVMAKNDIASRNFEDLMHVQVLNGITCDYYKKPEILSEFEQCFENVIEKNLIVRINESPYLGIMLDETCDISVEKKLAIYIRFIENGKATVAFLGNRHITDCKASGIEEALVEFLVSKGICTENLEKVFGLGTDGAAVMTGRLNGLGAKLKRRNAELVQVHCVAHRLNLAVSQAGKHNEYCQAYHSKIHSLYDYYTNSQPRYDRLRELQVLLHGKAQQVTEPTSVRWLSVEACVKKVFTSYDAIVMSLEGEKDPKAIGLFHFIANTLFLLVTALLIDVLTVIGILSLTFQKDSVDLSQIRHCLVSTTSTLEAMKNGSDQVDVVLQALGNVPPAGVKNSYNGVDIIDNNQLRQRFSNLRESYLNTLMEYLGDRFPENDIDLLECFDKVLNPMRYPNSAAEIQQYGQDQLETLCEHYNAIDRNRAHAAFLVFKHLTKSYKGVLSFPQYCSKLITELDDQYPDFATLARLALIIPVSSAPCERGFSVQNALKTKVRNRLNPERLNRLMFIKLVGPDVDQFDFPVAARMFENMKPRMK